MHRLALVRFVAFAAALAVLAGCGSSAPKRYAVSGTVKWKGDPIKLGLISFRSDSGDTGSAQITDGKYDIPAVGGLFPGKYKVAVNYPDPKFAGKMGDAPGESGAMRDLLPTKYTTGAELTADIKAEANVVNYDLK